MSSSNRAAVIAKAHKVLKKHFNPITPVERPVLEQLLYASCLENNRYDAADEGFARVQESFYDWNEVRVTTVRELAELLKGTSDPVTAATNLKHTLHSVFESLYDFNLESFKKQNLGASVKTLERFRGTTSFSVSFVVQTCFAGHSIPICKGSLEVLYIIGAINEAEFKKGTVPGLERAIPKNKGIEFGSLLHQLAAELVATPFGNTAKNILLEIAPDCKERLPKRQTKKKVEPEAKVAKTKKAEEKKPATKKAAPKKPEPKKKTAEKPAAKTAKKKVVAKKKVKTAATKKTAKKKVEKVVTKKAKKVAKKSATKKLARRKPR